MKILFNTIKVVAIFQTALGIIHCGFTPVVLKNVPVEIKKPFLFMFIITGLAFIYIGIVMFRETATLTKNENHSLNLINISVALILIAGILGAFTMPQNPFAWVTLAVGILGATIIYSIQLKNK